MGTTIEISRGFVQIFEHIFVIEIFLYDFFKWKNGYFIILDVFEEVKDEDLWWDAVMRAAEQGDHCAFMWAFVIWLRGRYIKNWYWDRWKKKKKKKKRALSLREFL